jgi:hypothetical protein
MPRQYIGALRGRYSSRTPALAYRGGQNGAASVGLPVPQHHPSPIGADAEPVQHHKI